MHNSWRMTSEENMVQGFRLVDFEFERTTPGILQLDRDVAYEL